MVVKTFRPVLQVLDEPFHQVLQLNAIYLMLQTQPFTCSIVPQGTICEYWFSAKSPSQLHEELVAYKDGPFA
jgi:hypothetical protein